MSDSESILLSVRKLVAVSEEDDSFDLDIIVHINAALATLYHLGVLTKPYTVKTSEDSYSDLFPDGPEDIVANVKEYLGYKTRLGFDTNGLTGSTLGVIKELISELEWRLMTSANPPDTYK